MELTREEARKIFNAGAMWEQGTTDQNFNDLWDKIKPAKKYSKYSIIKVGDGWYINFQSLSGKTLKSHGPYKTKSIANIERSILNKQ